jgi:DNA helicase-2/ATP-dependent DNA helicase PcrA
MKQAIRDCDLDKANFPPRRMLAAVSDLKNRLVDSDALEADADDFFTKTLAPVYRRYDRILKQCNALDFDDLLLKAAFLLRDEAAIREHLSRRFTYLLIDEYQDTNRAQYVIARQLVCTHDNICATGDPDQSIYRWRGADIRNILAFESDWPGAAVVKLEENFRSTPNILRAADSLIANNASRKQKKLISTRGAGAEIALTAFDDEAEEAEAVALRIKRLAESDSPGKAAVLYRINATSRVLEEAMIRNEVPYQIVRGVEFYNRREIRDMLAYMKVIANPDDEASLLRIINTPQRGIGKITIEKLRKYAAASGVGLFESLRQNAGSAGKRRGGAAHFVRMMEKFRRHTDRGVEALMREVFRESGLAAALQKLPDGEDDIENVEELINSAARYDSEAEEPSLADYLQQISLFSDADSYDSTADRVPLMTLHAAKGLEFDNVFIVAVEQGLLPHARSEDLAAIEEERRLFFVGMTRAKSGLHISFARYRTFRGDAMPTVPSHFLDELGLPVRESNGISIGEPTRSAGSANRPLFEPGQGVRHPRFGPGRVIDFADMGEDSMVTVRFARQTKTLMVKYAKLTAM